MTNVIQFPGDASKVTVKDILDALTEAVEKGEVQYLMYTTMGPNTNVKTAMTTTPAHCATHMNFCQQKSIETLMRNAGMIE